MSFRVVGLPSSEFRPLYGLPDEELAARGVEVHVADKPGAFPCRVSLRDAPVGTRMLLLNFEHQPANTPYRSRHAIFVEDGAEEVQPAVNEVPEVLARRTLSVRAFDEAGQMLDAVVVNGREAAPAFEQLLSRVEECGVRAFSFVLLFLRSPTREKYLRWLAAEFPRYLSAYEAAYATGAYLRGGYRRRLEELLERLRLRHGFKKAWDERAPSRRPAAPRQLALWA